MNAEFSCQKPALRTFSGLVEGRASPHESCGETAALAAWAQLGRPGFLVREHLADDDDDDQSSRALRGCHKS